MKVRDFVKKYCIDCPHECVRKEAIKECMRAYKDFTKHYKKEYKEKKVI